MLKHTRFCLQCSVIGHTCSLICCYALIISTPCCTVPSSKSKPSQPAACQHDVGLNRTVAAPHFILLGFLAACIFFTAEQRAAMNCALWSVPGSFRGFQGFSTREHSLSLMHRCFRARKPFSIGLYSCLWCAKICMDCLKFHMMWYSDKEKKKIIS